VNWSSAAFVTGIFPKYQNGVGHYGSWWTLTAITILSIPFVLVFLPETKGRSLEQIEQKLKGGPIEMEERGTSIEKPGVNEVQEMTTEL
jgi:hypothetical protein